MLGGRAHRQRLKRAFPGLAAGGEAVRSGGRVSVSDHRRRDIGLRGPGTAGFVRAPRRQGARDTRIRVLSIAAIGSPPSSRAGHPAGRGLSRAADRADARGASPRPAPRPASSAKTPPPRGGSVPRWVPASSPPRERSFSPFQIVGNVVGARPPPPHRPAHRGVRGTCGSEVLASFTIGHQRRRTLRAGIRRAVFATPLSGIPAPSPGGDARLIYQKRSAGQSPGVGGDDGRLRTRHRRVPPVESPDASLPAEFRAIMDRSDAPGRPCP
jgi:hypothetical protein